MKGKVKKEPVVGDVVRFERPEGTEEFFFSFPTGSYGEITEIPVAMLIEPNYICRSFTDGGAQSLYAEHITIIRGACATAIWNKYQKKG